MLPINALIASDDIFIGLFTLFASLEIRKWSSCIWSSRGLSSKFGIAIVIGILLIKVFSREEEGSSVVAPINNTFALRFLSFSPSLL